MASSLLLGIGYVQCSFGIYSHSKPPLVKIWIALLEPKEPWKQSLGSLELKEHIG